MELAISKTKKFLIRVLGAGNVIALKRKAMYCMLCYSMFKDRFLSIILHKGCQVGAGVCHNISGFDMPA